MAALRGKKGQSMVEFAMVLPVLLFLILGLIQLAVIFINAMAVNYMAYMTARTAAVYEPAGIRVEQAQKARAMLGLMTDYANMREKQAFKDPLGEGVFAAVSRLDSLMAGSFDLLEDEAVSVEKEEFENSGTESGEDEARFIRVTVTYRLRLCVPFVNRIFGLFQSPVKINADEALSGRLFNHKASDWAKFGTNRLAPYYSLRAVCVMRVG
ncbi:MAG TPA: pilus assembly protein [Candidatus Goldiibacteriota bacterium]|nr:pilus assembly protein [Candidatus Goldiibacteriota bacterium]